MQQLLERILAHGVVRLLAIKNEEASFCGRAAEGNTPSLTAKFIVGAALAGLVTGPPDRSARGGCMAGALGGSKGGADEEQCN